GVPHGAVVATLAGFTRHGCHAAARRLLGKLAIFPVAGPEQVAAEGDGQGRATTKNQRDDRARSHAPDRGSKADRRGQITPLLPGRGPVAQDFQFVSFGDRHVIEEFHRVKRLPPYVFAEVNRLKAAARARGADIIDLGMGNPDMPTPQHIVDKLVETVGKPRTNRYSASKGIAGLRRAQAAYYARRFGVRLNPETQGVATLGSKEGFANMAQAITAPGDVILVPSPTYPIHEFGFIISGAAIRHIPVVGPVAGGGSAQFTGADAETAFLRGIE